MKQIIDRMVTRFLNWRLPENFNPDAGITFKPEFNVEYMAKQGKSQMRHEPIGTNLFDGEQARQMIEYVVVEEIADLQRQLEEKTRMLLESNAFVIKAMEALSIIADEPDDGENPRFAKEALEKLSAYPSGPRDALIAEAKREVHRYYAEQAWEEAGRTVGELAEAEKRGERRGMERAAKIGEEERQRIKLDTAEYTALSRMGATAVVEAIRAAKDSNGTI